jgi:hypothetical protein
MRTFLTVGKKPIIKWGMLPKNTYYEGEVPRGYNLCISPSKKYVVIDVDVHGEINGFDNIPDDLKDELNKTLNYKTKNDGMHYWFKYTGEKVLANKTSGQGIDLRVGEKGYVVWYRDEDIRECKKLINKSSQAMNKWLEKLFSYV